MHLAPIIERYMSLERQEDDLFSELNMMTQTSTLIVEDYDESLAVFHALSVLHQIAETSAQSRLCLARMQESRAELAAMDKVLAEIAKKTQETRIKSKYSAT